MVQKKPVGEMCVDDLQSLIATAVQNAMKPLHEIMSKLQGEISNLKEVVEGLAGELSKKDEEINKLMTTIHDGLDEREQYSRRNNIRFFGMQERDNEDTDTLILDLATRLKVPLELYHIDRSHRVGKLGDKPRPIIVKFVSYAERSALFRSKKALKGTGITIREDLTKVRLDILKSAVSSYTNKAVWTNDGVIMVKVGNARPHRLKTEREFDKLLQRYPPSDNSQD